MSNWDMKLNQGGPYVGPDVIVDVVFNNGKTATGPACEFMWDLHSDDENIVSTWRLHDLAENQGCSSEGTSELDADIEAQSLDFPTETRIDAIGQNGPTGEHYELGTTSDRNTPLDSFKGQADFGDVDVPNTPLNEELKNPYKVASASLHDLERVIAAMREIQYEFKLVISSGVAMMAGITGDNPDYIITDGMPPFDGEDEPVRASEILARGAAHMNDRAETYDKPGGERSIDATVAAFNAITIDGLMNSGERGWLFMALLKMVRAQSGGELKIDNYEDMAAYSALMGESAAVERAEDYSV